MKRILLFGAGKSATCLIDYLIAEASKNGWFLTVVDADAEMAREKVGTTPHASVESFDINDDAVREKRVRDNDLVISLLPAILHIKVAKDCLRFRKHLLTASYISTEIQALQKEIEEAGILFMGEMGLDPGIDHMSVMKMLDKIRSNGHKILSFEGYCGALMAPQSDNNPWRYKFSWNPMAVVLAGAAGATYRHNGKDIQVAYEKLFHGDATVNVPQLGPIAYYPNRDSLHYVPLYHLEDVPTVIRATLRYPEFCRGWDALVSLGLTDHAVKKQTDGLAYSDWTLQNVPKEDNLPPRERMAKFLGRDDCSELTKQLEYIGLLDANTIGLGARTNAEVLLHVLMENLKMQSTDRDMVVMLHKIRFGTADAVKTRRSCLIVEGKDSVRTAIAKTVGLPLGILAKLLLLDKIHLTGLHIPVMPEVYFPVLEELETHGIRFKEYDD